LRKLLQLAIATRLLAGASLRCYNWVFFFNFVSV